MSTAYRKPELAMPAGTIEMVKASIINGADAVYFGGKKFNARIPAANFFDAEIKDAVDFCHLYGKKAYLTLNVLIKDSEMKEAIELAKKAYEAGIDAVILQDLGLMSALKKLLPKLELHASTQMTCHSVQGAEMLADLGVKRIVLARELSIIEVKEIRLAMAKRNVDIECFVHGALCFSYSGQCMFSSFAFNKSGNRGVCLQPCRMTYDLFEAPEEGATPKFSDKKIDKKFVLSMKDLTSIHEVKALVDAGIDSFKVEGRLKGISYVAAVAKAYRRAIDDCFPAEAKEKTRFGGGDKQLRDEDIKMTQIAFQREPTRGYLFEDKEMTYPITPAHKGVKAANIVGFNKGMLKLELYEPLQIWDKLAVVKADGAEEFTVKRILVGTKEVDRSFGKQFVFVETGKRPFVEMGQDLYFVSSRRLADMAFASLKRTQLIKYKLRVFAVSGANLCAVAEFGGQKVRVNSNFVVQESTKNETGAELIKDKVFKASEFFEPEEFSAEIKGKPFVPLSILKDFKNEVLLAMKEELFLKNRKEVDEKEFAEKLAKLLTKDEETEKIIETEFVVFAEAEIAEKAQTEVAAALNLSPEFHSMAFYYKNSASLAKMKALFAGKKMLVKSPNIQSTSMVEDFASAVKEDGIICSNLGALRVATERKKKNPSSKFWVDRELNAFNSLSIKALVGLGADIVVPSVECSLAQLKVMAKRKHLAPLVFFYPVLMTSKAYTRSEAIDWKKKKEWKLVDRKGFEYRVIFDESGVMRLYNPLPVDMLFELEKFKGFGMIGIDLISAKKEEVLLSLDYAKKKARGAQAKKVSKFTRGHYEKEVD